MPLAGGFAILAVLFATSAAASASGWSRQRAAKPVSKDSVLTAVSCTSRKACVAVGYFNNRSGKSLPVVERWNGARAFRGALERRSLVDPVEPRRFAPEHPQWSVVHVGDCLHCCRFGASVRCVGARRGSASGAVGWFKVVDRANQRLFVRTRIWRRIVWGVVRIAGVLRRRRGLGLPGEFAVGALERPRMVVGQLAWAFSWDDVLSGVLRVGDGLRGRRRVEFGRKWPNPAGYMALERQELVGI